MRNITGLYESGKKKTESGKENTKEQAKQRLTLTKRLKGKELSYFVILSRNRLHRKQMNRRKNFT